MPVKMSLGRRFGRYLAVDFTKSLHRNFRLLTLITVAFVCVIAVGALAGIYEESAAGRVIREEVEPKLERIENEASKISYGLELAAHVIANNVPIAVEIVGLGLVFGIFPVFVLIINGLVLGYLPFYLAGRATDFSSLEFFSVILPHGLIELSAILIAATCGIRLGIGAAKALIKRGDFIDLKAAGRDVTNLLPASLMLLVIAGFVEGFISPVGGPGIEYVKLVLSAALFSLMLFWFSGGIRRVGR